MIERNVIVLGSTGYLGNKIVHSLVAKGYHVLCLKRPTSDIGRLQDITDQIELCNIDDFPNHLDTSSRKYTVLLNVACQYVSPPPYICC